MTTPGQASRQTTTTSDALIEMMPTLRIYARNLVRGGDEADDLVQETLMKALANVARFEPGTNLRAWLFTIMRNSFLTRVNKRAREPVGRENCVSGNVICFPRHDVQITGNLVFQAIDRLPSQYREALILVFVAGESYQDVARICDCAMGTVKSRVNRGRQMLMDDLGVTHVSDLISVNYG